MRNAIVFAATIFIAVSAGFATAQDAPIEIRSQGQMDTRIPVAVPPFVTGPGVEAYGPALAQVLANDLDFSGEFTIVAPHQFPRTFTGLPADARRLNFAEWKQSPAEMLVHGIVRSESGMVVEESRLFDVKAEAQIVGKRLRTDPKWSRLLAHQFADEVVRHVTGTLGIASSEIAFSGAQGDVKEIYIADYDAGIVTQVTRHGSLSIRPKFSPDGKEIAYLSYKDRYPWIYIYNRESGESRVLSKRVGLNHAPAWSPDGRRIAFVLSKDGNTEVYIKNVDGTSERRLTNDPASDTSPVFSPDGRYIAFVSDRAGRAQIYIMNSDGTQQRRVSYQGGSSYDPNWSPDGRYIAYIVEKSGAGLELWIMHADGSNARALTSSSGSSESPTWSPDSRHVMFTSSRSGSPQLYTVTVKTGIVRQLPNLTHMRCEGPTWGPRRN